MTTFDPKKVIFTPNEAATYTRNYVDGMQRQKSEGFSIGIPGLRDYFAPLLPGQCALIIAQTSNNKSGTLRCIERLGAEHLMECGREDEAIVHVSVEEPIEEQVFYDISRFSGESVDQLARGRQNWSKLEEAAVRVGQIPIYRIGDLLSNPDEGPNLTVSNMIRALKYLESRDPDPKKRMYDKPLKFAAIMFDYLQAFPIDQEISRAEHKDQRRLQVRNDLFRIKQAGTMFGCGTWIAVQAKQKLDGAISDKIQLPGIYDGEELSSIGQRPDRIITQWMPKMTLPINSTFKFGNEEVRVEENLMYQKVAKQRGGLPSGRMWKMRIDFDSGMIAPEAGSRFMEGHTGSYKKQ